MKTLAELQAIRDKAREKMTVRGNNEEAVSYTHLVMHILRRHRLYP